MYLNTNVIEDYISAIDGFTDDEESQAIATSNENTVSGKAGISIVSGSGEHTGRKEEEIKRSVRISDVVLYREDKNWIYFVESVTTVGPMDPKRIIEITEMTQNVRAGKIFVTAFLDFQTYKKFAEKLAWETEVWLAEMPDHMIHLNGDKFLGPR